MAGAVVNVGKPKRFLRRLFQAAGGNYPEDIAEGVHCRFPQLRHFPEPLARANWLGWGWRRPIFAMGKIRRQFQVEFKQQLVAQIEAGQLTVAQAARDYQLAHSVVDRWRAQYRNNTLTNMPSARERQLEADNEKLRAKIGELVMQVEHLKKWQTWVQEQRSADTSVITAKNWDRFRKPAK